LVVEPDAEQVRERAVAERRVVQPVGFGLRERTQLGDGLGRQFGIHEQSFGEEEQPRHRHEVVGIVGQLVELHRVIRHRRVIDDAERVAVARRLRAGLASENAGGAAAILDHQRLAEFRFEFLRRRAHDDVGHAAGGDRDDQADRLVGPGLSMGG
jgi:hypothetical protein